MELFRNRAGKAGEISTQLPLKNGKFADFGRKSANSTRLGGYNP
jgi:hypothetical protein